MNNIILGIGQLVENAIMLT